MTVPERILIVGFSVAGVQVAQELRQAGYAGAITAVGEERYPPYDRPPVSKEMLAPGGTGEPVPLLPEDRLAALEVDLRLGVRATGLDPRRRVLATDGGEVGYDVLVVATGSLPRTLPSVAGLARVHTIRTAEDARSVRADLASGGRLLVVGGGFIGAEVAAAGVAHGLDVTVVEAEPEPLALAVGDRVGASLRRLHEAHGVRVLTGSLVQRLHGEDRVAGAELGDGTRLDADIAVIGIGARPATDWLAGSGLPVADGIECDAALRVNDFPGIYAAGDVARRPHPLYPDPIRIEHWTNAGEHARVVAADIMGTRAPAATVPYVWSDQYGHHIQMLGRPSTGVAVVVTGEAGDGDLVAAYEGSGGRLVGAVIVDNPRLMLKCRKAILAGKSTAEFRAELG